MEDRLEILPLRSARVVATQASAPAGVASVPPHLGVTAGILLISYEFRTIGGREPLLRPMLYGPCIVAV